MLIEDSGKRFEFLFPIRRVDVQTERLELRRFNRLTRHVCRRVLLFNFDGTVGFYLDEALYGSLIFAVGFQPDDASKRIDVVVYRHQNRIRKGLCSASATLT